jgi:amidase
MRGQSPSQSRRFSRRTFLTGAAIGGVSVAAGSLPASRAGSRSASDLDDINLFRATIPQLRELIGDGDLTSRELTERYLSRIERLNPLLHAVIEVNPDALRIADRRDQQARSVEDDDDLGPLHGIPILVKDNIATDDKMETTAGSLALVGSVVPADATVVARLRRAGAVILGKANLSEWANFRGFAPFEGWSARGGFTRDPYKLGLNPSGSSSGSAVAAAANLATATIGTETDGSIVAPSGNNLVVGLKPTVGLVSQSGIIPIGHSQDTAGPIGRNVTDVAVMLNTLKSPFGRVAKHDLPHDYTDFLDDDALEGSRIGIDRRQFEPQFGAYPDVLPVIEQAIDEMADAGAEIIDPVDPGDPLDWFFDFELPVLLNEFKHDIRAYLRPLGNTSMRNLADLIQFNVDHCTEEMKYFGQELFEMAQATSGDLTDPDYLAARQQALKLARREGINQALEKDNLDAILTPSFSFGSSGPAVSGFPIISVPVGLSEHSRPAGVWLSGGFLSEPKLIALAYAIEQLLDARTRPRFLGHVPPEPPDAGLCDPSAASGARSIDRADLRRALPRPSF